jgi:hypothetical protein
MSKDIGKTGWQPSPQDAINLAALRYYAMEIERKSTLIYFTDPSADRPILGPLTDLLASFITQLNELAAQPKGFNAECCPPFVLCSDGLCHPPGTCSS